MFLEKVIWTSPNENILIVTGSSYYGERNEVIYKVFTKKRFYLFNSNEFYKEDWIMQYWFDDVNAAFNFASMLKDEVENN